MNQSTRAVSLGITFAIVGCTSASPADPDVRPDAGSAEGGVRDAALDTSVAPALNCVSLGTPNNEAGIGGYCHAGGGECAADGGAALCSDDFGAPPGKAFCTKFCATDAECGSRAYCADDPRGHACVPLSCGNPPDAGARPDSSADAHDDGGRD